MGTVSLAEPFVIKKLVPGNFSPRSSSWSVQLEHPFTPFLKLRVGYLQNVSDGLIILNAIQPREGEANGASLLSGNGRSRYRQFEVTAKTRVSDHGQLFFSYVRSRARGDLNDFGSYLGSFPVPIVRPNEIANLPTDLPNRFLSWGLVQLPWNFRIAPSVEFRSGFPYALTDSAQNYVGVPNDGRFPRFLSVDARLSKDFKMNPKYTVRLSVSGYNLTKHFNPEAFHNNIGDPAAGLFFGQRGRHFTADFDVVF